MRRPMVLAVAVAVVSLPSPASAAAPGTIDTLAGSGAGNGRPGLETHLWGLGGVGADPSGRVYFAETGFVNMGSLRVRMWDPVTEVVRTVAGAGMGVSEPVRENVPAVSVDVNARSVAADANGNLYLYENTSPGRIRRVDAQTGRISTIYEEPFFFPAEGALEIDAQGRVLFGNLSTIQRWDPATKTITLIAGGGPSGTTLLDEQPATSVDIGQPMDIETDAVGNIYFSESQRIRWIDTEGIIHTLAGGRAGVSTEGQYGMVTAVSSGTHELLARPDGSLWYTDGAAVKRIAPQPEFSQLPGSRRVTTAFRVDGGFVDGPLAEAGFGTISDLEEYPGGGFLVADAGNLRVRLVGSDGQVRTIVGNGISTRFLDPPPTVYDWTGDGGPATDAAVLAPCDVALAPDGDVLFTEREAHHKVRRIDAETGVITTVAGADRQGFSGDGGPAVAADLLYPCGLAVAPNGDVFVADTGNNRIRKIDAGTGRISTVAGNGSDTSSGNGGPATSAGLVTPVMLAFDDAGNLYVSETGAHQIRVIRPDGIIGTVVGTGVEGFNGDGLPGTATAIRSPLGMVFLPEGSLVFSDSGNDIVRVLGTDGRVRRIAGTRVEGLSGDGGPALQARFDAPNGLAYHEASGTLFVADVLNQVIRKIDADGVIHRVAGNGQLAFCGDGGPAVNACLRNPQGLELTPEGDLLFAELSNLRVRRIHGVIQP